MSLFRELRLRPIVTGLLSNVPGLFDWWDDRRSMGNTSSSSYCRAIWQYHLDNYRDVYSDSEKVPSIVAEFGPGATLGVCIAALLDGVNTAIGLDVSPYASNKIENLRILDELVAQSEVRTDYYSLADAVKNVDRNRKEARLRYAAPWTDLEVLPENQVEMIFSHSVMEHVLDPAEAYRACFRWLKPGGVMSHKIDHSSHAITKTWNGHYGLPDWIWAMIVGRRPYLLNRLTPLQHLRAMEAAGFQVVVKKFVEADESDSNSSFQAIDNRPECRIKSSLFICKK